MWRQFRLTSPRHVRSFTYASSISNAFFEAAYQTIKRFLEQGRYRSVIFNLDQCGHSHVQRDTILDIMHSYPAAEIFYTFVISSLLAFLSEGPA